MLCLLVTVSSNGNMEGTPSTIKLPNSSLTWLTITKQVQKLVVFLVVHLHTNRKDTCHLS